MITHAAPTAPVLADIEPLLARTDLTAYRGWLKYLRQDAAATALRSGADSEPAKQKAQRLADWANRIAADPPLIEQLTGVQEWAYESRADDSGQPFKFAIPTDYAPAHPAAMSVYMHGYSGNQLEHATGMASTPGVFLVSVLGRSRAGGYMALSEADVLDVVDYIAAHWAIDPDRIHLTGGSMGGGGTYRLGARYPHRWASGRPSCGHLSLVPPNNLTTFPIYATHSDDDPAVPILEERGPLALLRAAGGRVIFDQTTGYGHAVWNYTEGNQRGDAWEKLQVRPDSQAVRTIDYTAVDGGALRGWWGEIVQWGDAPKPARFVLTVGMANTVFAELTNVRRLRLRLAESPVNRSEALYVSVDGTVPISLAAPLPEFAVLARRDKGWTVETETPHPAARWHTPGSAGLLYAGDPLLIVYGTRGTDAEKTALRVAAEAASKSPNAAWAEEGGPAGAEGVPHLQNLYGHLRTKPDSDVTAADIARCHLVLIGTAGQNSVVAQISPDLPVKLTNGRLTCSDGATFPADGMWGLVHFNPLAPDRLIFWVGSGSAEGYRPGALVPRMMGGVERELGPAFGADLLILGPGEKALVATRWFDSEWHWGDQREHSHHLPRNVGTPAELTVLIGTAARQAVAADLALVALVPVGASNDAKNGARWADLVPWFGYNPTGIIDVSGAEVPQILAKVQAGPENRMALSAPPGFDAAKLAPERRYRIAVPASSIASFGRATVMAPKYWVTSVQLSEAWERLAASE